MDWMTTVLCALLGRVLGDEFKDRADLIANRIVRIAVNVLPPKHREQAQEEWSGDLSRVIGNLSKMLFALDLIRGAARIRLDVQLPRYRDRLLETLNRARRFERPMSKAITVVALMVVTSGPAVQEVGLGWSPKPPPPDLSAITHEEASTGPGAAYVTGLSDGYTDYRSIRDRFDSISQAPRVIQGGFPHFTNEQMAAILSAVPMPIPLEDRDVIYRGGTYEREKYSR